MSGAAILWAALAAGLDFRLDGDGLILQAHAPPPQEIIDALARHKREVIDLLRPGRAGWSAENWQAHFNACVDIAEFDDGLPHPEAETRAFECCLVEWLIRTFARSPPGQCQACDGGDHAHDVLIP